MKRRSFLQGLGMGAAWLLLNGCASVPKQVTPAAASAALPTVNGQKPLYQVEDAQAPVVYFTREISGSALVKIYEALGRKPQGKVGIKISFETPNGPYLNPQLLKPLCDKTKGTLIDCNGFTPPRHQTQSHMQLIRNHGFTNIATCDILDADGDIDMPVANGYHLKYARTGAHFADYSHVISVVRFKAHHIAIYGGTMKNLTITLGSISGKAILHSAGKNERYYQSSDKTTTAQSLADGVKAALDYKKDAWCFINVLDDFDPDDKCQGTKNLGNIGILASLDPVAVDQAAVDLTFGAAATPELRQRWEDTHSVDILQYAENLGVGKRHYRLVALDN